MFFFPLYLTSLNHNYVKESTFLFVYRKQEINQVELLIHIQKKCIVNEPLKSYTFSSYKCVIFSKLIQLDAFVETFHTDLFLIILFFHTWRKINHLGKKYCCYKFQSLSNHFLWSTVMSKTLSRLLHHLSSTNILLMTAKIIWRHVTIFW